MHKVIDDQKIINNSKPMLLTLFAIITLITIVFLYIGHLHHKYVLDTIINEEKKIGSKIYANTFKNIIEHYESVANSILANEHVIEALEKDDREELLKITAPIYKQLTNENPFMQIMHFHTKYTRSYLRLHKTEKYGDDLSSIRHMINRVNTYKLKQIGIEAGRFGIHYRIALPIFSPSKKYLGAFEIGVNINYILEMFKRDYEVDSILLFNKEVFKVMFPNYAELQYHDYSDKYYAIDHNMSGKIDLKSSDNAIFTVTQLKNASGVEIGEIKFVKNIKYYTDKIDLIRNISILAALILLSLSFYFIYKIFNGYVHLIHNFQSKLEIKNRSLMKLSNTDHLTKIHNRHSIETLLKKELNRAARHQTELSVAILDIDNFKKINDTYGHNIGDKVLRNFAKTISSSIRETDHFGRWGGEEFIIISADTSLDNAVVMCEKVREKIYGCDFQEAGQVSCSIGVTSYMNGDTHEKIVYNADTALYEAKHSGKNKVVTFKQS